MARTRARAARAQVDRRTGLTTVLITVRLGWADRLRLLIGQRMTLRTTGHLDGSLRVLSRVDVDVYRAHAGDEWHPLDAVLGGDHGEG